MPKLKHHHFDGQKPGKKTQQSILLIFPSHGNPLTSPLEGAAAATKVSLRGLAWQAGTCACKSGILFGSGSACPVVSVSAAAESVAACRVASLLDARQDRWGALEAEGG